MAGKRNPKLEDKAQSRRFVETARKLEVDEKSETFDRALKIIVPKKEKKKKS